MMNLKPLIRYGIYILICGTFTIVLSYLFLFITFTISKEFTYNIHSPLSLLMVLIPCIVALFLSAWMTRFMSNRYFKLPKGKF